MSSRVGMVMLEVLLTSSGRETQRQGVLEAQEAPASSKVKIRSEFHLRKEFLLRSFTSTMPGVPTSENNRCTQCWDRVRERFLVSLLSTEHLEGRVSGRFLRANVAVHGIHAPSHSKHPGSSRPGRVCRMETVFRFFRKDKLGC